MQLFGLVIYFLSSLKIIFCNKSTVSNATYIYEYICSNKDQTAVSAETLAAYCMTKLGSLSAVHLQGSFYEMGNMC